MQCAGSTAVHVLMQCTCSVVALLLLLAISAAPSSAGGGSAEFSLVKLPNAKCIDGSPAAYYIARNSSSNSWVVWLEGGGMCQSVSDCQQRAKSALGSSTSYATSITAPKGMLESDPERNPDLYSWNRVYVSD